MFKDYSHLVHIFPWHDVCYLTCYNNNITSFNKTLTMSNFCLTLAAVLVDRNDLNKRTWQGVYFLGKISWLSVNF